MIKLGGSNEILKTLIMEKTNLKIKKTFFVTHDVKCFRLDRPEGYSFEPGQATEVSINKSGWEEESRPFTFTSLPEDDMLEFIIKTYPSRKGVTNELLEAKENDELILHDIFGAIKYKGPGVFIAGGAGVTPFISIFRKLRKENKVQGNRLIFGNKKSDDIILEDELNDLLGDNFINILSDEKTKDHDHGLIDREYLEKHMGDRDQMFYVCGPPPMMDMVVEALKELEIPEESIVKEGW